MIKSSVQITQPIRLVSSPTWGPTYGFRCSPYDLRYSLEEGRIGGQAGTRSSRRWGYLYTVTGKIKAEALDDVITGMISICHHPTSSLFDPCIHFFMCLCLLCTKIRFVFRVIIFFFMCNNPHG